VPRRPPYPPPTTKLNGADARVIQRLLKEGQPATRVAEVFGLTRTAVANIGTGRQWHHVTGLTKKKR